MKIQKANQPTLSYPTQEKVKPILLSLTTMITLSACNQPISPLGVVTPPKNPSTIKNKEPLSQESNKSIETNTSQKEIPEPEVLGGIPMSLSNWEEVSSEAE